MFLLVILGFGALAGCQRAAGPEPQKSPPAVAKAAPVLYQEHCAQCHDGGVPKAIHAVEFQMMGPEAILTALTSGAMQAQGQALSEAEKRSLAEFLGGQALGSADDAKLAQCDAPRAQFDTAAPPKLNGWGMTAANSRAVDAATAGITSETVAKLAVRWAFAFPAATRARSQPTVGGGSVYVGSQDGTVYALDFKTGCVRWRFKADAEVRSSPVLEPWRAGDGSTAPRLWFGDFAANAYAVDARTGTLLWKTRVHPHARATITGSPRFHDGRLFVPVSSSEWAAAADPAYECCTFQGAVVALDANAGTILWSASTIDRPAEPTGTKTSVGTVMRAPAGAPVWNSPTIDAKRNRLYVGTGEGYTSPAVNTSDSVVAFDLTTGKKAWHYQSIAGDAWNMACFIGGGPNCPAENGPDLDIGASPVLTTLKSGKQLLVVGQKSADVFALDPDRQGKLVWRRKIGRGGYAGGVHWGLAAVGDVVFAPNADTKFLPSEAPLPADPGLHALDAATGKSLWFTAATNTCPEALKPACDPGLSAPATAAADLVFAGGFDGVLKAYAQASGKVLWEFDTKRDFATVGGNPGRGGSIEAAGPVVVDGTVLLNSGYLFGGRVAGNVLLAFSVDGQ
jgi:polyvinyl alcohol dehydrogenase (cytochrome)